MPSTGKDTEHQTLLDVPNKTMPPENKAISEPQRWNTKNISLRCASDFVAAASAACLVAPIITIIDKGIMENASGRDTLRKSLTTSIRTFLTSPQTLLLSKPFGLICMLYGGTYMTANSLDTFTSTVTNSSSTLVTSGPTKFFASSGANIGLCLIKDRTFAQLFGPTGPPRAVPGPSFVLFALRDCFTIFASFNIPPLLGPYLSGRMSEEFQQRMSGQTAAQFLAPAGVQILSTPLHLLGLDLYNRQEKVPWQDRLRIVRKNWSISALARMCRIVPAFGVGGVVNAKVRRGLMEKWE